MPNRFETPLAAQFINTYTPIPFEEMAAAGKYKQERYDKAANAVDATIGALDEIQAIPNSNDELRAKEYSDRMRNIRDKYITRDLSDPFVQRELSNEINNKVDKEDIKHIQESYQGYLGYNKLLGDYATKGLDTPPELIQQFEGYNSKQNGVFTGVPQQQLDVYGDTRKFFEDMEMTYQGPVDLAPGVKGLKHAITQERILNHAKDNIDAYMALPSVRQYIEVTNRRGLTNGRSREEIALEYVKNHAPEFVRSTVSSPFQYDPTLDGSGGRGNPSSPEVAGTSGENANTSKPLKMRQYENLKRAAEQKALSPMATNKDLNDYQVFKDIEESNITNRDAKVKTLYETNLKDLIANAASTLVQNEGMSKEDALSYVSSLVSNKYGEGDLKTTMDAVTTSLKGEPSRLWKGFRENLTEDKARDQIRNTILANTPNLIMSGLQTWNPDKVKKAAADMENSVEQIAKNRNNILSKFKDSSNKSDVVKNLYSSLNELDKQVEGFIDETNDNILKDFNKTRPNQSTYKLLNNDYITDSSGRVMYEYTDLKGKSHKEPSAISKSIKDWAKHVDNYQYRPEDKKLQKSSAEKIQKAVDNNQDIQLTSIMDEPDEFGNIRANVAVVSKDKSGNVVKGSNFEILLPSALYNNEKEFFNELTLMGQDNLVFNLSSTNTFKEVINSFPWYAKNEQVIPLNNGNITIKKSNGKFDVYTSSGDVINELKASGLNYNELPYRVRDIVYSITRPTK